MQTYLSGCCNLPKYAHPPAACQRKSSAADQEGSLQRNTDRIAPGRFEGNMLKCTHAHVTIQVLCKLEAVVHTRRADPRIAANTRCPISALATRNDGSYLEHRQEEYLLTLFA
jgi:hypothetical protein